MNKLVLAMLAGSTALATGALAQSQTPAANQNTASVADCDRVLVVLEQRRMPNAPITIEQARIYKRDANAQACRDALNKIEQASAQGQTQTGAQNQQAQAGQQNAQQPGQQQAQAGDPARIVVQPAQPSVTVQQGQPEIFVRQPQPTITVDIPQPEIVVRMPRPEVNVSSAQPQVQVQQNTGQPNVQVQQAQNAQANVRYEREQPRVVVNQPQGQPTVRFEQPGEGRQAGDQNQQRQAMANQQQAAPGQRANQPATTGAVNAGGNLTVARVTDMDLYGAQGEQLGEIEHVFQGRDGKQYIVIGRGGFLGLGERHVAVPADRIVRRGERLVVQGMTNDQIKGLPTFNRQDQSFRELEDNQQVQFSTAG